MDIEISLKELYVNILVPMHYNIVGLRPEDKKYAIPKSGLNFLKNEAVKNNK